MKLTLTKGQRRIAVAAAIAVGPLLWLQADNVGLDDTPWLAGVLVIAALLGLAFSPEPKTSEHGASSLHATSTREMVPSKAFQAAYNAIEANFMPLCERSLASFGQNEMTRAFADHVRLQATKLAWIITAMVLEKEYPGFRKGQRFEGFRLMGGIEARKYLREMPGIKGPDTGNMSLNAAAKELAICEVGLDQSVERLRLNQTLPLNPAYQVIERDFPFAKVSRPDILDHHMRLDEVYGPLLRLAVSAARENSR